MAVLAEIELSEKVFKWIKNLSQEQIRHILNTKLEFLYDTVPDCKIAYEVSTSFLKFSNYVVNSDEGRKIVEKPGLSEDFC